MTLVEAIGRVLDANDKPMLIKDLVDVIDGGYFDELELEGLTESKARKCIKENSDSFRMNHDFVAIKGQVYSKKQLLEISEELRGDYRRESYRIFIVMLFYFRFKEVFGELDLDESNPSTKISLLKEQIKNTLKEIRNKDEIEDTDIFKPLNAIIYEMASEDDEILHSFLDTGTYLDRRTTTKYAKEFYSILRTYDWSIQSISIKKFDWFLRKLLEVLVYEKGSNSFLPPSNLSKLLENIVDIKKGDRICDLNTVFGEFLAQSTVQEKSAKVSLYNFKPEILFYSYLRLLLLDIKDIELLQSIFASVLEADYNKLIMMPPFGTKRNMVNQLKEGFDGQIEAGSIEELYLKIGLAGLEKEGKAFFFVPDKILFGGQKSLKQLRERIVEKRWLRSVVNLPTGVMSPYSGVNVSMVIIEKSSSKEAPFFIDFRSSKDQVTKRNNNFEIDELSNLLLEKIEKNEVSRFVDWSELKEANYHFGLFNYFNPSFYKGKYIRSEDESLCKLSDVVNKPKLKRKEVSQRYSVLNMKDLADDPGSFTIDVNKLPFKSDYKTKLKLLDQDAVLIGKVGGNLKPSLFKFEDRPVFIGKNVIALEPSEKVDPEYLVGELNSDFVQNQLEKLPRGSYIPNIKSSDLLSLFIRLPNQKDQQVAIFNDWIKKIAQSKVEQVKSISSQLRLVEKEYISRFKHDFMQILEAISSGIDNVEVFLKRMDDENRISLKEPVAPTFPGEKEDFQNSIGETIKRVNGNLESAIEYLDIEMRRISGGKEKRAFKTVKLKKFLKQDWLANIHKDNFSVQLSEQDTWPEEGVMVKLEPHLMKSALRNLVENAKRHGFTKDKSDYEIHVNLGVTTENSKRYARILIANNGNPLRDDMSIEDIFKPRISAGDNKGKGLGGSQLKNIIEDHDGIIRDPKASWPKELWPIQFEILIPIVEE